MYMCLNDVDHYFCDIVALFFVSPKQLEQLTHDATLKMMTCCFIVVTAAKIISLDYECGKHLRFSFPNVFSLILLSGLQGVLVSPERLSSRPLTFHYTQVLRCK